MTADSAQREALARTLRSEPNLDFSVLVGSRALGQAQAGSDWDIALQWARDLDWMTVLANTETLRHKLANALGVEISAIDLIELRRVNLAMRVSVAEEGVPMSGEDTLDWAHFLQRTWRELEMFYWDKQHAV